MYLSGCLTGEHIGLVGANGEGKSHLYEYYNRHTCMPDEGKVEWNKHVRVGYLDQHAVLEKGMTIEICVEVGIFLSV